MSNKGFVTYNLSPSTPAESVINFIKNTTPDAIIISITLSDSIASGQRLASKIKDYDKKIPIFVGGQAITEKTTAKFAGDKISNLGLSQISKILKPKQKG